MLKLRGRFSWKVHPWKLTWHWKIPIFNRKYIFKCWIFHCHVSFRGRNTVLVSCLWVRSHSRLKKLRYCDRYIKGALLDLSFTDSTSNSRLPLFNWRTPWLEPPWGGIWRTWEPENLTKEMNGGWWEICIHKFGQILNHFRGIQRSLHLEVTVTLDTVIFGDLTLVCIRLVRLLICESSQPRH